MKALLTEKTKQEKIIDEVEKRLIEKRNLLGGLGLTSLIAACGAADNATNGATNLDKRPTTDLKANDAKRSPAALAISTGRPDSDSSGGHADRDDPDVKDLWITVKPEQRGLNKGDIKGYLIFRIANGNHADVSGNDYASTYTTLTTGIDLLFSSDKFGDPTANGGDITGAIYIFWNIKDLETVDLGTDMKTLQQAHFKVAGVLGDVLPNAKPEFYKIGDDADQPDMVFKSGGATDTTAANINILWDVTKYASDVKTELTLGSDATSKGILQVQGAAAGSDVSFTKINNNEGYDMVVEETRGTAYILWDIAKYYDADANTKVEVSIAATAKPEYGLLTVIGATITDGSFIKINNNDNYDMVVIGGSNAYILWDVANYHDAADAKAVVNLANPDTIDEEATHGLLTITGLTGAFKRPENTEGAATETGYTDIDGGGINDLAFVYGTNTYILFGEKVANRDGNGKAISHTVNPNNATVFYDKAGAGRTVVADDEGGFFDFDLDGDGDGGNTEVENVGYRFIGIDDLGNLDQIKTKYEAVINPDLELSEEAYWDIA